MIFVNFTIIINLIKNFVTRAVLIADFINIASNCLMYSPVQVILVNIVIFYLTTSYRGIF